MRLPRSLSVALRVAVSAALVGWMLSRLDLRDMARWLAGADLGLVLLTLAAVAVDRLLMAARWIYLLETIGVAAPRARAMKIFFLSTFFGSFLPTGVGGDAVRAVSFSRLTARGAEAVASVAMDRVLGLLSMLLTGLLSLAIFYRVFPHPALLGTVFAVSLAAGVGLALVLVPGLRRPVAERLGLGAASVAREGWRGRIARTVEALGRYGEKPGALGLVLGLSVGVQLLRVLQAYLLSEALRLGTPLVYFFCFVPLILLVTMLPVSVSGWGPTNLAYVALFGRVGMDPDGAFVLSVLILALGIVGNLPGGVLYALEGFRAAEAPAGPGEGSRRHGALERAGLVEGER